MTNFAFLEIKYFLNLKIKNERCCSEKIFAEGYD